MKKVIISILLFAFAIVSFAQNTKELPYWSTMTKRTGSVAGDSIPIYHSGKYYKIPYAASYTDSMARAAISAMAPITYNPNSGTIGATIAGSAANGYITSTNYNAWYKKVDSTNTTVFLRRDGNSSATTGKILIGNFQGFEWDANNSISGSAASGFVQMKGSSYTQAYSTNVTNEVLRITNYNGWSSKLFQTTNSNTNITLPATSGTLALLSDIPSISYPVTSVFGRTGAVTATSGDYTTAQVTESGNLYYTDARSRLALSGTGGVSYNNTTGAISFNLATGNTWTANQTAPAWVANGTGGAGYIQVASQSSTPAAVSGSLIISSDNLNRLTLVRRNIANSADITRTLSFPDASYSWTFPTPASGTSSTLAGLETAQTFTQTQTFPTANATTINITDFATGIPTAALTSDVATQLRLGGGFTLMGVTPVTTFAANCTFNGTIFGNTIRNRQTGTQLQLTTNTSSSAGTPGVYMISGAVSSGSFMSGSCFFDVGTSTGTRGGMVFFNTNTEPTWNGLQRGFYVGNATAAATGNPTAGFYNWAQNGDWKLRTSGGTVNTIGTNGVETTGLTLAYAAKTTTYTIVPTDYTVDCTTGTFTVTLPTAVGATGKIYTIINSGSGTITIATTSSQTIGGAGATTKVINTQDSGIVVQSDGANYKIISRW